MATVADEFELIARRLGATGCTPEEIARVEADQGVALPANYRAFLRSMGRDAGGLFVGTDIVFPDILGARDGAMELLLKNQVRDVLPATAVVVYLHQGYICGFLDPAEGSDPPVWEWMETSSTAPQVRSVASSLLELVVGAERSSRSDVRHRIGARNFRGRALEHQPCPRCGASPLTWGGRATWGNDTCAEDRGRYAMTAHCLACGSRWWRWADDDVDSPLLLD
jgi:hypothetical protein